MRIWPVIWIRSVMPFFAPIAIPAIPGNGGAGADRNHDQRQSQSQLFHGFFRFISLKRTFLLIPKICRFVKTFSLTSASYGG